MWNTVIKFRFGISGVHSGVESVDPESRVDFCCSENLSN